jgi:hypothetical protein
MLDGDLSRRSISAEADGAFTVSCGARHYRLMGLDKGQRKPFDGAQGRR